MRVEVSFTVPKDHPCFAGHFPGAPIVPGAVLLSWLRNSAEQQFTGYYLAEVRSIKFQRSLSPGDEVRVVFSGEQAQKVRVAAFVKDSAVCKATFCMRSESTL